MLLRHALNLKWTNVPLCLLWLERAQAHTRCEIVRTIPVSIIRSLCAQTASVLANIVQLMFFSCSRSLGVCVCEWFTALTPGTMASNLLAHKPTAKPPPSQWIRRPIACNRNDEMMILRCLRLRRTQAGIRAHHHTHKDRRYAENTHAHARASTLTPASTSH